MKEMRKSWAVRNPDKVKAAKQRWAQTDHGKAVIKKHHAKRRAFKAEVLSEPISPEDIQRVLNMFGGRCMYCGETKPLASDHVEPLSKGGADVLDNLAPACKPCNSKKSNKNLADFLNEGSRIVSCLPRIIHFATTRDNPRQRFSLY